MESNRINFLLDKYYSGEISPKEYDALLSALNEVGNTMPELEAERKIFHAIESCEPIMPVELEKRLEEAIDRKRKRIGKIVKLFISGSAAAIILLCTTIGLLHYGNNQTAEAEFIAKVSVANGMVRTEKPIASEEIAEISEQDLTEEEEISVAEISDEDLEEATQIVDEILLNALSAICISQNNVVECIENVKITQETDFNIF